MKQDAIGTFYGVGLGPGDPELVTLKAGNVLRSADRIYTVASRQSARSVSMAILAALPGIAAPVEELTFSMSNDREERRRCVERHADTIAAELCAGRNCAFGTIGDPMTYSTCSYLLRALRRRLPGLAAVIVPGVNSWSALAAAAQIPLAEDDETLRIVPSYRADTAPECPDHATTVLLKTYRTRNRLLESLPSDAEVWYGANLGLEEEMLLTGPESIAACPEAYLSMLAVKRGKHHD